MYNKYDISEFIFEEFQGGREFMNYLSIYYERYGL